MEVAHRTTTWTQVLAGEPEAQREVRLPFLFSIISVLGVCASESSVSKELNKKP